MIASFKVRCQARRSGQDVDRENGRVAWAGDPNDVVVAGGGPVTNSQTSSRGWLQEACDRDLVEGLRSDQVETDSLTR